MIPSDYLDPLYRHYVDPFEQSFLLRHQRHLYKFSIIYLCNISVQEIKQFRNAYCIKGFCWLPIQIWWLDGTPCFPSALIYMFYVLVFLSETIYLIVALSRDL